MDQVEHDETRQIEDGIHEKEKILSIDCVLYEETIIAVAELNACSNKIRKNSTS